MEFSDIRKLEEVVLPNIIQEILVITLNQYGNDTKRLKEKAEKIKKITNIYCDSYLENFIKLNEE